MNRTLAVAWVCLALATPLRAATVDGLDIHSIAEGSGPTIIFVHGWTCDVSSWREQIPAFATDYRTIALDLPGHGSSDSPAREDFSIALFAHAVDAVRDEADAGQVVLVGHSMGVAVIRQYAILYPDRVAGLVAVDGPLDLRGEPPIGDGNSLPPMTREMRESMIRGMFVPETPESLQEHILSMMLGTPEATAVGAGQAMFDPAIRTDDVIDVPALNVIAGTAELPDVTRLREVVPAVEIRQMEETGHFLMMEKPEEFNRLMRGFLERIGY